MRALHRRTACLIIGHHLSVLSSSHGAPLATIEGGPEALGHSYQWTVTNTHSSPLVGLQIPHYRASLFFAPKGWTFSCSNLVGVGSADAPGLCTATAGSSAEGIAPGRSATFGVQIAAGSVKRGFGEATVRFADSSSTKVGGVLVPMPETLGDKYIPLTGLGVILASLVIYQLWRARKPRTA